MQVTVALKDLLIQRGLACLLKSMGYSLHSAMSPGPDIISCTDVLIVDQPVANKLATQQFLSRSSRTKSMIILTDGSPLKLDRLASIFDIRVITYPIDIDDLETRLQAIEQSLNDV